MFRRKGTPSRRRRHFPRGDAKSNFLFIYFFPFFDTSSSRAIAIQITIIYNEKATVVIPRARESKRKNNNKNRAFIRTARRHTHDFSVSTRRDCGSIDTARVIINAFDLCTDFERQHYYRCIVVIVYIHTYTATALLLQQQLLPIIIIIMFV